MRAENAEAAKEHLIEQISKYLFKVGLSNRSGDVPKTLGSNIITENSMIHKDLIENPTDMVVEEITGIAYIYATAGKQYWKEWI